MAAGVPVIASNIGGIPEIVQDGETGLLVSPTDSQTLSQAIIRLIKDEDLRRKMGDLGKERVKEFSSKGMTKKIEQIYDFYIQKKLAVV